jgi:hypothetical protein
MNNFKEHIYPDAKKDNPLLRKKLISPFKQNLSFIVISVLLVFLGMVFYYKFRNEQNKHINLCNIKPIELNINATKIGCYSSTLQATSSFEQSTPIICLEVFSDKINKMPLNDIVRPFFYELKLIDSNGKAIYSSVYNGHFVDAGISMENSKVLDIDTIPALPAGQYVLQFKIISPLKPFADCKYFILLRHQVNSASFVTKINLYKLFSIVLFVAAIINLLVYLLFTIKLLLLNLAPVDDKTL